MTSEHQQTARERRRGFRRVLARALAVSVLLHAALFALWRVGPPPAAGTDGSGESAPSPSPAEDALRVTRLSAAAASADEPERTAAARTPEVGTPVAREPAAAASGGLSLETVPESRGRARLALAPSEGSAGPGDGTSGSPGEPGRISPPVPRSLLPEWDPPESVRGTRVTVRVEVGRDGRPTGRVRLEPRTQSEDFNRRLRRAMTSLRYRPATRAGEPVVAWAEITFVF